MSAQTAFDFIPRIPARIEQALKVPIAARNDPETSKLAAQKITRSGKRESQQLVLVALVKKYPRRTSAELAKLSNGVIDRYAAARRLPELEQSGLARKGETKYCSVTSHKAVTWESWS